jgi:hypothetical protein
VAAPQGTRPSAGSVEKRRHVRSCASRVVAGGGRRWRTRDVCRPGSTPKLPPACRVIRARSAECNGPPGSSHSQQPLLGQSRQRCRTSRCKAFVRTHHRGVACLGVACTTARQCVNLRVPVSRPCPAVSTQVQDLLTAAFLRVYCRMERPTDRLLLRMLGPLIPGPWTDLAMELELRAHQQQSTGRPRGRPRRRAARPRRSLLACCGSRPTPSTAAGDAGGSGQQQPPQQRRHRQHHPPPPPRQGSDGAAATHEQQRATLDDIPSPTRAAARLSSSLSQGEEAVAASAGGAQHASILMPLAELISAAAASGGVRLVRSAGTGRGGVTTRLRIVARPRVMLR